MKTLVALYDTMNQARQAVEDLKNAGFNSSDISLVANNATGEYTTTTGDGENADGAATGATAGAIIGGIGGVLVGLGALAIPGIGPVVAAGPLAAALSGLVGAGIGAAAGGILGALVDAGVPEQEASYYAEGVRRGGALLTARIPDNRANDARMILERYSPVNVHTRAEEWRKEGWTGFNPQAKPYTRDQIEQERRRYADMSQMNMNKGGEVTIPVVEEKMNVGKREVQKGGVRIQKVTEERPVEADVTLREEHVNVERRPVNQPVSNLPPNAFTEGTIQVTEKAEKPVVNKQARVTEEVVVRKDVEQHTEKIQDTVRRSDVKVQNMGTQMGHMEEGKMWHEHYTRRYGSAGHPYDYYEPAYQYGMTLREDRRYSNWDWDRLEPEARRSWEQRYRTPWEQVKDAVRYSWEEVKAKIS